MDAQRIDVNYQLLFSWIEGKRQHPWATRLHRKLCHTVPSVQNILAPMTVHSSLFQTLQVIPTLYHGFAGKSVRLSWQIIGHHPEAIKME